MSSDLLTSVLPSIVVIGIADILAAYAAYIAIAVRGGLSVSIFRSRALWTAVLAVLLAFLLTLWDNTQVLFPPGYHVLGDAIEYFVLLPAVGAGLLIWIDRTVKTLIRLDYLRRDVAGWRRFNPVYWALFALNVAFAILPAFFASLRPGSAAPTVTLLTDMPTVVLFAYSAYALFLGSRRTRDKTFRRHATWFGYLVLSIFLVIAVIAFDPNGTQPVLDHLPFLLIAYCLYGLSKNLVPVNRLLPD